MVSIIPSALTPSDSNMHTCRETPLYTLGLEQLGVHTHTGMAGSLLIVQCTHTHTQFKWCCFFPAKCIFRG